jgi:hypothetical protein
MLEDSRIPEPYKLGGRLSSEFLDGVDYAEQRIMEKGVEVWLARDGGVIGSLHLFRNPPSRNPTSRVFTIHNFNIPLKLPNYFFPEVTFENSPVKARIILED